MGPKGACLGPFLLFMSPSQTATPSSSIPLDGRAKGAPTLSIVIPVFNEQENLPALHEKLTEVLKDLGQPYEIILVDDGSTDRSLEILKGLQAQDPHLIVVEFNRNYGQHAAVFAGFDQARGQIIVTLDADLQNPPEAIPDLVRKIEEGYDVVGGWR